MHQCSAFHAKLGAGLGRSTPMNQKIARQLSEIRKRYTSLEQMAEALRLHPGFEELNRATLSRWLKNPTGRAPAAVRILSSRRHPSQLRIAQPNTISVIPSWMVTWEPEEGKPYGLLQQQYGVDAEVETTRHGGDAFEVLVKGKVEIALIPGDLVNQLGRDCQRICLLSHLYVTGIASQPIASVYDLKGKTLGFPFSSAFGTRLDNLSRTWGISLPPPIPLRSIPDCVQALVTGRVAGFVGSEPSVSQVRRGVEKSQNVFPIPHGVLGSFEMHVAVNLKSADPPTVRAYLTTLEESARYANARKSVAAFLEELASRFDLDARDAQSILSSTMFSVGELEPRATLTLWEREAVELRNLAD